MKTLVVSAFFMDKELKAIKEQDSSFFILIFVLVSTLACLLSPVLHGQNAVSEDVESYVIKGIANDWQGRSWQRDSSEYSAYIPTHISEVITGLPSTWISRGSGQEHLTAIRSPVLTGPGACGAFLILENGIKIRPSGFCNANGLFETVYETSDIIEVVAGPASATLGGNALHGAINVVHSPLVDGNNERGNYARIQQGAFVGRNTGLASSDVHIDVGHLKRAGDVQGWRVRGSLGTGASYRESESSPQAKLNMQTSWVSRANTYWNFLVSATALDQMTAGYVRGFQAYKDDDLSAGNDNTGAYRQADALRSTISAIFPSAIELSLYARNSDMSFQQHWKQTKPVESNSHVSVGTQLEIPVLEQLSLNITLENGAVELDQYQQAPTQVIFGTTYEQGYQYDYSVDFTDISLALGYEIFLNDVILLTANILTQELVYDYEDLREEPVYDFATHTAAFTGNSVRLGLQGRLDRSNLTWHLSMSTGFRPPQIGEIYRLEPPESVAEGLSIEKIEQLDGGITFTSGGLAVQANIYSSKKSASIAVDENTDQLTNFGGTSHFGVEMQLEYGISPRWLVAGTLTYSQHKYDDVAYSYHGNAVDTAPELMARWNVRYQYSRTTEAYATLHHMSEYYIDTGNVNTYAGHNLLDIGMRSKQGNRLYALIIKNVLDTAYAERADFAFGSFRYFPGNPRSVQASLEWKL